MSLQVKLSLVAVAADALSIKVQDTTGVYNASTNPGGYGAPNYAEPTRVALLWRYWTALAPTQKVYTGANVTSLLGAGLSVTPDLQALTTTLSTAFADGVQHIKYVPLFALAGTATFVQNSKSVVCAGLNPQTLDKDVVKYLHATGASSTETAVYEIDWTATGASTTTFVLTEVATANFSGTTVYGGGLADLKVLVNKAAEKCIVTSIGTLSEKDNCAQCAEVQGLIQKLIRWRFAADVKFDVLDYDGAHNLVVSIGKVCDTGDCGC